MESHKIPWFQSPPTRVMVDSPIFETSATALCGTTGIPTENVQRFQWFHEGSEKTWCPTGITLKLVLTSSRPDAVML
jgi:hypothetical protein